MIGNAKTIVQPKSATAISSAAYNLSGRIRNFVDAAIAVPSARPAMKLERINAAAQMELPNARPLSRSQSVSKISAPIPDKKTMPKKNTMRTLASRFGVGEEERLTCAHRYCRRYSAYLRFPNSLKDFSSPIPPATARNVIRENPSACKSEGARFDHFG